MPNDMRFRDPRSVRLYLFGRRSHPRRWSSLESVSSFQCVSFFLGPAYSNIYGSQAAKDVYSSHETLLDIFGRVEMFFQRLEMYTEVPLTTEMTEVIIEIIAEVLSVLGIATKEIRQSRKSE